MYTPVSFAVESYKWGAYLEMLKPMTNEQVDAILPVRVFRQANFLRQVSFLQSVVFIVSKGLLKDLTRVVYCIGVSTLVAPLGVLYHLTFATCVKIESKLQNDQSLSEISWKHINTAGTDFKAFLRGSVLTALSISLFILGIFAVKEGDGFTMFGGIISLCYGLYGITETPVLKVPFKSLDEIRRFTSNDTFEAIWAVFARFQYVRA